MKPNLGAPRVPGMGYDLSPRVVVWETTRSCDAACRLCPTSARFYRHTQELTTDEARELMDEVRRFGRPRLELVGGEPFRRPDLQKLVEYAVSIGLPVAVLTPATDTLTPAALERLRIAGLGTLGLVVAGASRESHERRGGAPGTFARAMNALTAARRAGLAVEVVTPLPGDLEVDDLEGMVKLLAAQSVSCWRPRLPLLAPRSTLLESQGAVEKLLLRIHELAHQHGLAVEPESAPQYRRIQLQRDAAARRGARSGGRIPLVRIGGTAPRARAVNDGSGVLFVSDRGDLCPSGSLRLVRGNVRTHDPVAVYRESETFRDLRDLEHLTGKCGYCEFRGPCGGSRGRAYSLFGDAFAAEPFCAYVPRAYSRAVQQGVEEPLAEYYARRLPTGPGPLCPSRFVTLREILSAGEFVPADGARG